jgi:DHA2 family multidrug resistance protein-like MFS transporter
MEHCSIGGRLVRSTHERRWQILIVLCIAAFLVVIDNTVVNVALPTLARNLHASNSSLQWIVDGYSLPFAGLLLAGAGLSDRVGRKRVMQIALVAFAFFSFFAARSHNVPELLTARALMGGTAAFIFPATLSILTTTFEDASERAKAFGIWGATAGVAVAVGPIVGGSLLVHFWFGSIFLVNIPIVVVALVASSIVVPESKSPGTHAFDLGGLILGTIGVSSLVLAIIQGPSWGWRSGATLALFGVAAIFATVFSRYEIRREAPLLDVRIFRNGIFSAGAGTIATSYFCLFGFIFLVTQYFQLVRGYSALSAGVHTLPFAIVTMVVTPVGAIMALRLGTRSIVSLGLLIMAVALAWATTVGAFASFFGPLIGIMVLLAMGFSLTIAPSTAALMETLRPEQIGAGAAVNETTRELGGTVGVALVGSVFSSVFGPQVRSALAKLGLSTSQLNVARSSLAAAQATVTRLPSNLRSVSNQRLTQAFMEGFHRGCLVASCVAALVALTVFYLLPGRSFDRSKPTDRTTSEDIV